MTLLKINLNETIHFTLTEKGKNIYKEWEKQFHFPFSDIDYPTSLLLWEFMEIFGSHLYMGSEIVVENNIIVLEKRS